ncbi:MAG: GIY-YIG nuclease family protein [Oxalobacter sp.]
MGKEKEMIKKRSVNMLLLDEAVTGRIRAGIANWTGVVFKIPRIYLSESRNRPELQQTGVYLLFGETDGDKDGCVYVGQASERANGSGILGRIFEHDKNPTKNYWQDAIIITTTDNSLGATEITYLESQLHALAKQTNRYDVMNVNEPTSGNVTETTEAEMSAFLENVIVLVGMLGHRVFEPLTKKEDTSRTTFYLQMSEADARMQQTDEGFVVLAGSKLSLKKHPSCPPGIQQKRNEMTLAKIISEDGILQEDRLFKSPSGASMFCLNRPSNGKIDWKDKLGRRLDAYLKEN